MAYTPGSSFYFSPEFLETIKKNIFVETYGYYPTTCGTIPDPIGTEEGKVGYTVSLHCGESVYKDGKRLLKDNKEVPENKAVPASVPVVERKTGRLFRED